MTRDNSLDRIRVVLTALVILHHTAITYGAPGGWYYIEPHETGAATKLFFILFVSTNQAYFMGFFFLIAGYLTPDSYQRKGPRRFLLDRFVRLGIPWIVYATLINPLCNAIAQVWGSARTRPDTLFSNYLNRVVRLNWGSGPLWFAEALLIFSLGYAAWRALRAPASPSETPLPDTRKWILSALGVGVAALLIRQVVPVGKNVLGMQLGFFATYIFMFCAGVAMRNHGWREQLEASSVRSWLIASILLAPTLTIAAFLLSSAGKPVVVDTGFSFPAIFYAFWEPFVAWGIIPAYLYWFRKYGSGPSTVWQFLASSAYTVYIVHAPILIAIGTLLRGWAAPAFAKFLVAGTLAALASLLVSAMLLRVPGARRIL